jgi:cholesterol transport system auxiliary component
MPRLRVANAARSAAAFVLCASIAGCGGGSPQQSASSALDLTAAPSHPQRSLRAKVNVLQPVAAGDLDSDRVLVRTGSNDRAVLAGARWSDRLPVLIQSRLDAIFDASAKLGGGAREYNLETDVRAFELDADARRVEIDIAVKLVSAGAGRVVATKTFKAEAAIASTAPQVVTAALDGALQGMTARIYAFVASSL